MKIYSELDLKSFDAWSGAEYTLATLTEHQIEQLECMLEDAYPDGMSDTELNDLLWFERDWIAQMLGFRDWAELESGDEEDEEYDDDEEFEEEDEE